MIEWLQIRMEFIYHSNGWINDYIACSWLYIIDIYGYTNLQKVEDFTFLSFRVVAYYIGPDGEYRHLG
jgi:hypothetical protein